MAGLSTAHALTTPATIYQRGWRLGGKAASHRGPNGRIEEHGLHVWLGYYDNAFRLMRQVYDELDRTNTDPGCPIATIDDAFFPSHELGVFDQHDGSWAPWLARFSPQEGLPGVATSAADFGLPALVQRGARLLVDLLESLGARSPAVTKARGIELSGSPTRTGAGTEPTFPANLVRRAEVGVLVGAVQMLNLLMRAPTDLGTSELQQAAVEQISVLRDELRARITRDRDARRLWGAVDLVTSALIGVYADKLLAPDRGFHSINDVDFRDWLAKHGAGDETLESGLVRGMYDLVFAYRAGDRDRPAFEAGTGLHLAGRFFFDYKGALFWKMRAGMGETVIAPTYQVLTDRGVDVRLFHRLDKLRLDDSGRRIEAIELVEQQSLAIGTDRYDPLVRINGLPCFPDRPVDEQLAGSRPGLDLERHGAAEPEGRRVVLRQGVDFDEVVLAVSLGMIPHVAEELVSADRRWADMVSRVSTVSTQAAQVWTTPDEAGLGWPAPGSTLSAYVSPFDTYSSMPHLIDQEEWGHEPPGSVGYFCAVLDDRSAASGDADALVRRNLERFLEQHGTELWPKARRADGSFDWAVLHGSEQGAPSEQVYISANTDPSDRYVQSVPDSGRYRLPADGSGFENLFLAGDWVDTGMNAGCIEAAVISGLQAANAVEGRQVDADVLGGWTPSCAGP